MDSAVSSIKHVRAGNPLPLIEDFNRSATTVSVTVWWKTVWWDPVGAFITVPLLTHGQFHERPQRQRRSRPHGSECSSSAGGTCPSLERNLGNRKDHTALIITFGIAECTAPWCECHHEKGLRLFGLSSCDDCSLKVYENYKPSQCFDFDPEPIMKILIEPENY